MAVIDDRTKRINLKSKRKKTLMKKVMEMSQLFNLGIFLVIHDHEFNKVYEYNSGTYESGLFQIDDVHRVLKLAKCGEVLHKYFTNDDFVKFKSN